jgi:FMN phosphatase YigB (HAD superfamily)
VVIGIRKKVAIVDIDGVVADVRHRVHHVEQRPKNWKRFFAEAVHDEPHAEGLAVVAKLAEDHEVVFLTGRPEHLRSDTTAWLARHGLDSYRLLMRAEGDRGPSARFKVREVDRLARHREIAIVIDDDDAVIAAMRAAGYATLHADWETRDADAQASLFEAQEVDGRT